jgi:hypothetical protein
LLWDKGCFGNSVAAIEVNGGYGKSLVAMQATVAMESQWLLLKSFVAMKVTDCLKSMVDMENQWLLCKSQVAPGSSV